MTTDEAKAIVLKRHPDARIHFWAFPGNKWCVYSQAANIMFPDESSEARAWESAANQVTNEQKGA